MKPLLLETRGLKRTYRRQGREVEALGGVDVQLPKGSTTAFLGRSGSGKSTLARSLALLERPDGGEVLLDGHPTAALEGKALAAARRSVQLVVQDPARAVNPRFTVEEAVGEPFLIEGIKRPERRDKVAALLQEVELDSDLLERPARRLSGGQIQRLALARALACRPRALILDEAMSGLDLSIRARLIDLLQELQSRHGLTYLILSHDRAFTLSLAEQIYMLEAGLATRYPASELLDEMPGRSMRTQGSLAKN